MAVTQPQPQQRNWRDVAIERSEAITDAWEVTKTYAGRLAEWVLFGCMIANIIEVLPGVHFWEWISNTILGIQIISLDVGGFSLNALADQAKERGDLTAARKANITGWFLIGLMIVTLLCVAIAVLFPNTQQIVDLIEKGLVLVRVVMIVIYGKVIHGLRRTGHHQVPTVVQDRLTDLLQQAHTTLRQEVQQMVQASLQAMQSALHTEVQCALSTHLQEVQQMVQASLQAVQQNEQVDWQEVVQTVVQEAMQVQSTRLVEHIKEVTRERIETTVATGHTEVHKAARKSVSRGGVHSSIVQEEGAQGVHIVESDEGAQEVQGARERVYAFLAECTAQGGIPTLRDIMEQCNIKSKHTAIKYRRELLGEGA